MGWGAVAAGLRRGLSGFSRRTALTAHAMTWPGTVLVFAVTGFGAVHGTIVLTAEWWALALATGLRPERLLVAGSLPRLAAWSALTVLAVAAATPVVLHA